MQGGFSLALSLSLSLSLFLYQNTARQWNKGKGVGAGREGIVGALEKKSKQRMYTEKQHSTNEEGWREGFYIQLKG